MRVCVCVCARLATQKSYTRTKQYLCGRQYIYMYIYICVCVCVCV